MVGAHPRVGGENGGSLGYWPASFGLIPAWAGKTLSLHAAEGADGAHPRVGGENRIVRDEFAREGGSSPRGRGKPGGDCLKYRREGLIPAWAGKTLRAWGKASPKRAHPRVGGENPHGRKGGAMPGGSSPRGRGKPGITVKHHGKERLIPAWAGKTR